MDSMAMVWLPLPILTEMLARWVEENPDHKDREIIKEILSEVKFSNQFLDSGISPTAIN